ncbi:MAG: hypothetical protein FWF01_02830 [Alphaproteobacteria bacterium]|nr:hypothetical protein [Alphaproteobacteria bacterium]
MDARQYELHKAIAGSEIETAIFHEKWTADTVGAIRRMLAGGTLPKTHWLAIPRDMQALIKSGGQADIGQYWLNRARRILAAYQDYDWPFMDDSRDIALYEKINLLSEKGEELLRSMTPQQAEQAVRKSTFDLDLMRDFSLAGYFQNKQSRWQSVHKDHSIYPISGCYNKCAHCFIDARTPMVSMPFPVYLKLMGKLGFKWPTDQGDAEFLAYYDKVMGADYGDFLLWLQKKGGNPDWRIMAKGIIDHTVTALSLSKMLSLNISDWRRARISLPLCDGEDIDENIRRCKSMHSLFKLYGKPREDWILVMGSPSQVKGNIDKIKSIGVKNISAGTPSKNGRACGLNDGNFIECQLELTRFFKENNMNAVIDNQHPMQWDRPCVDACGVLRLESPRKNGPTTCRIIPEEPDIFGRPQDRLIAEMQRRKAAGIHR